MAKKLEALEMGKVHVVEVSNYKEPCVVCDTTDHDTSSCPVIPGVKEAMHGQVNAIGQYQRGVGNPYSNTYNPGWKDHPNFN